MAVYLLFTLENTKLANYMYTKIWNKTHKGKLILIFFSPQHTPLMDWARTPAFKCLSQRTISNCQHVLSALLTGCQMYNHHTTGKKVSSYFQASFYLYSLLQEEDSDEENTALFLKMDLMASKITGIEHAGSWWQDTGLSQLRCHFQFVLRLSVDKLLPSNGCLATTKNDELDGLSLLPWLDILTCNNFSEIVSWFQDHGFCLWENKI